MPVLLLRAFPTPIYEIYTCAEKQEDEEDRLEGCGVQGRFLGVVGGRGRGG